MKTRLEAFTEGFTKNLLAIIVIGSAILAVTILGAVAIGKEGEAATKAKDILTLILPLLGTWVGTVLAYYYSKESLKVATESVTQIASRMQPAELSKFTAVDVMLKPAAIASHVLPAGGPAALPLDTIMQTMKGKGVHRCPILNSDLSVAYIVHDASINTFKTSNTMANPSLQDLLGVAELEKDVEAFATIPETATLADAKAAMEATPSAEDVFVTKTARDTEPMPGWITDKMIQEKARVG